MNVSHYPLQRRHVTSMVDHRLLMSENLLDAYVPFEGEVALAAQETVCVV